MDQKNQPSAPARQAVTPSAKTDGEISQPLQPEFRGEVVEHVPVRQHGASSPPEYLEGVEGGPVTSGLSPRPEQVSSEAEQDKDSEGVSNKVKSTDSESTPKSGGRLQAELPLAVLVAVLAGLTLSVAAYFAFQQ